MLPLSLPPNGGQKKGTDLVSVSFFWSPERAAASRVYGCLHPGANSLGVLRHPQGVHCPLSTAPLRNVMFMNFLTFCAQTIQNRHFVIIPRIRAAQGTSDGRNFGGRERVTEQVRRDYTKTSVFCMTRGL